MFGQEHRGKWLNRRVSPFEPCLSIVWLEVKCLRRSLECEGSFFSPHFDTVKPTHTETHTSLHKGTNPEGFSLRLQRHPETSALLTSQPRLQLSADLSPALSGTSGWALRAWPFVFVGNIPNTDILYVWVSPGCSAFPLNLAGVLCLHSVDYFLRCIIQIHTVAGERREGFIFLIFSWWANLDIICPVSLTLSLCWNTSMLGKQPHSLHSLVLCCAEKSALGNNKQTKKYWLSCDFCFLLMSFPQMEIPVPSYDLM